MKKKKIGGHNLIDFTGQKIDFLTIIKRDETQNASNGSAMWECECECGRSCTVSSEYLRKKTKSKKSCGCQNVNNPINLKDKKIGRLTVIERAENHIRPNGNSIVRWKCKCECGNEIVVESGQLTRTNNKIQSCGCLAREKSKERIKILSKRYNEYNLTGSYGIGYTRKGEEFWFDLEDYDKIKDYCWYMNQNGYVMTHIPDTKKGLFLHRLIMDPPDKMYIDHINHNKIDNRKQNLRIVTMYQNNLNKGTLNSNTSGITGVYYKKDQKKWEAYITANKKRMSLGQFDNKKDAIKARKEAEEKYFGEYSYDNSMKGDENNEQKSQI